MTLGSDTDTTLSEEEIQSKAERWPLFRRYAWAALLIAGTIGIAILIARWAGIAR